MLKIDPYKEIKSSMKKLIKQYPSIANNESTRFIITELANKEAIAYSLKSQELRLKPAVSFEMLKDWQQLDYELSVKDFVNTAVQLMNSIINETDPSKIHKYTVELKIKDSQIEKLKVN